MKRRGLLIEFVLRAVGTGIGIALIGWLFVSLMQVPYYGPIDGLVRLGIVLSALWAVLWLGMSCWAHRPWPHVDHIPTHGIVPTYGVDVPAAKGWFSAEQLQQTADEHAEHARKATEFAALLGDEKLIATPPATPSVASVV
jgi:hypothetical protein